MGTKVTQTLIVNTAIKLFNEFGAHHVSTNRIADACNLSKGNVHYHFKNKESLIQSIFERMTREIEEDWGEDYLHPTLEHMAEMFHRQLHMIWEYRFFYRELTPLLHNDRLLKRSFAALRKRRIVQLEVFFESLIDEGFLVGLDSPDDVSALITNGWIISDYWLSYIDVEEKNINSHTIREGYSIMTHSLWPYLTNDAKHKVDKSFALISQIDE
jgi:AcrR family transcriptional regulator